VKLSGDNLRAAGALAGWRRGLGKGWSQVKVAQVQAAGGDPMHVGSELSVEALVQLGSLSPGDVQVQLFHGLVDNMGEIPRPSTVLMTTNGAPAEGGAWLFQGTIPCRTSGQHGY